MDPQKIPRHIAMIMDGNGRWAKLKGLPRLAGHARGVEVVDEIVQASLQIGIRYLTLYSFSQENWNRPAEEVQGLMELLHSFIVSKRATIIQNQIRLKTIGEIERLPLPIQKELQQTCALSQDFQKMTLVLALSYGSRAEILHAVQALMRQALQKREIPPLTPTIFSDFLETRGIPDPDLLIRTSGEHRISNFLLWQMAYTELYFTDTLWPDFNSQELFKAIESYQHRERRFGKTSDQLKGEVRP